MFRFTLQRWHLCCRRLDIQCVLRVRSRLLYTRRRRERGGRKRLTNLDRRDAPASAYLGRDQLLRIGNGTQSAFPMEWDSSFSSSDIKKNKKKSISTSQQLLTSNIFFFHAEKSVACSRRVPDDVGHSISNEFRCGKLCMLWMDFVASWSYFIFWMSTLWRRFEGEPPASGITGGHIKLRTDTRQAHIEKSLAQVLKWLQKKNEPKKVVSIRRCWIWFVADEVFFWKHLK